MSTGEVAKRLGVSRATVQYWCRKGLLAAGVSLGGHYRITAESVDAMIARLYGGCDRAA